MLPPSLETLEVLFCNSHEAAGTIRYFAYSASAYPALRMITIFRDLDAGGQVEWKDEEDLAQMGMEKEMDSHYAADSVFSNLSKANIEPCYTIESSYLAFLFPYFMSISSLCNLRVMSERQF